LSQGISKVGQFKEDISPFGVMDMGGNVREWVLDRDEGYLIKKVPIDASGIPFNVVRGSDYTSRSINAVKTSFRSFRHPKLSYNFIGFRCVTQLTSKKKKEE